MAINWFPGHMVKTKREIQNNLKLVDAVIEIRDARIPKSSKNPDIDTLCAGKPRVILLNKSDLTDPKVTKAWKESLTNDETIVLEVKAKGLAKITTRAMVVGIPNVGKSTFINKMAKNNIAKTGDRPGVTKNKQWIKTKLGIELMDTPGVLWPKFEDEIVGLNLAFTGAIKDEIMDTEELALKLVERLQETNPEELMTRYKLTELHENPLDNLDAIARKRGAIMAGNQIDYNRIAGIILDEFRGGKIGKISLEKPE